MMEAAVDCDPMTLIKTLAERAEEMIGRADGIEALIGQQPHKSTELAMTLIDARQWRTVMEAILAESDAYADLLELGISIGERKGRKAAEAEARPPREPRGLRVIPNAC